jgi:hypothetical protein
MRAHISAKISGVQRDGGPRRLGDGLIARLAYSVGVSVDPVAVVASGRIAARFRFLLPSFGPRFLGLAFL